MQVWLDPPPLTSVGPKENVDNTVFEQPRCRGFPGLKNAQRAVRIKRERVALFVVKIQLTITNDDAFFCFYQPCSCNRRSPRSPRYSFWRSCIMAAHPSRFLDCRTRRAPPRPALSALRQQNTSLASDMHAVYFNKKLRRPVQPVTVFGVLDNFLYASFAK